MGDPWEAGSGRRDSSGAIRGTNRRPVLGTFLLSFLRGTDIRPGCIRIQNAAITLVKRSW